MIKIVINSIVKAARNVLFFCKFITKCIYKIYIKLSYFDRIQNLIENDIKITEEIHNRNKTVKIFSTNL